jgi:hypothetical protein
MAFEILGPTAKANVTKSVDSETRRGQGFRFINDKTINRRRKKKTMFMIPATKTARLVMIPKTGNLKKVKKFSPSSTLSITELFPTEARKYRSFLYTVSQL